MPYAHHGPGHLAESRSRPFFFGCHSANTYWAPTVGQAQSQDGRENSAREQQPCGERAAAEALVPASKESDRAGQAPLPPGGLWEQGGDGWPWGEGSVPGGLPKEGSEEVGVGFPWRGTCKATEV